MILDGDILEYFESISVDVNYEEGEISSFAFLVSYREFDSECTLTYSHMESFFTFTIAFLSPKSHEIMAEALNALNSNTPFKAYYNRIEDTVYVEGFSFVTEDNFIKTIEYYLHSLIEDDYEYIENLYNSIYKEDYESIDDDSLDEKEDDDTSIEEDFQELMSLLNKY